MCESARGNNNDPLFPLRGCRGNSTSTDVGHARRLRKKKVGITDNISPAPGTKEARTMDAKIRECLASAGFNDLTLFQSSFKSENTDFDSFEVNG
jgi:hypothetical protein